MKEIGGYIEFERYQGEEYYTSLLALNCGRNCLSYMIECGKIKKIYFPYLICDSVVNVCKEYNVEYEYYHISNQLRPIFDQILGDNEWLYLVNYYGQIGNEEIVQYKQRYHNLIVDNAQAFYQKPVEGIDTLYTCRKFFGVPDGAYLSTNKKLKRELEQDISFPRMNFLMGRYEKTASEFYDEYVANNDLFKYEPIKLMSKLTHNLLRGLDYEQCMKKRGENSCYLHDHLGGRNRLELTIPSGLFMYPLWIDNGAQLRKRLQKEKIYIPKLWPNVLELCDIDSVEYQMVENILPLPVDQRYGMSDMQYVIGMIIKLLEYK